MTSNLNIFNKNISNLKPYPRINYTRQVPDEFWEIASLAIGNITGETGHYDMPGLAFHGTPGYLTDTGLRRGASNGTPYQNKNYGNDMLFLLLHVYSIFDSPTYLPRWKNMLHSPYILHINMH